MKKLINLALRLWRSFFKKRDRPSVTDKAYKGYFEEY